MAILLAEQDVDLETEALDDVMDAAEPASETAGFYPTGTVGDLSRGGKVGDVEVFPNPTRNARGRLVAQGRASARRAWMWDGTETVLPLAWNPEGTQHDGGRSFLRKKHCTCCGSSGFKRECRVCFRNNCATCNAGQNKSKVIPCFYLKKEQVPFPQKFYGPINCFMPFCPRRDGMGFKTEEEMRVHGQSRHRMEYRARQETLASQRSSETDDLKRQVAELRAVLLMQGAQPAKKERTEAQQKWARTLGARSSARAKAKAVAKAAK